MEELFGGKVPTPKTLGNYLRRFEKEHIDALKKFLTTMGYTLRAHTRKVHPHKGEELPYFKIDGTAHEQTGRKMEGESWLSTKEAANYLCTTPNALRILVCRKRLKAYKISNKLRFLKADLRLLLIKKEE
ncbi:MAG: helix-turn-helix domain-containing protein [Bdellovibrionaceae bacterium]|nr:helix-turn-helix domain-containing protein [Pseudobdellovibrionaceae bacterium]